MGLRERLAKHRPATIQDGNGAPIPEPAENLHQKIPSEHAVDLITARRCGSFAAYGLTDVAIGRALMLTSEQLQWVKETEEYRDSYARQMSERAQRVIDLEEGWDSAETRALTQVLESLETTADPRFALQIAITANKATRRTPGQNARVIDASRAGSVITLTMNKQFVTQVVGTGETGAISPTPLGQLSKRLHDVPTPKEVTRLLKVNDRVSEREQIDRAVRELEAMGISPDLMREQGDNGE